jgi:hypothetical protein
MMPEYLYRLDLDTTLFSQSGLTIEQWVNRYVESGRAASDYDRLLDVQRQAWLSELRALDMRQLMPGGADTPDPDDPIIHM